MTQGEFILIIAIVVYLIGWYVTTKLIINGSPIDIDNKEATEEEQERMQRTYYVIVGIAALWVLWVVIGILYGLYYLIRTIHDRLFD